MKSKLVLDFLFKLIRGTYIHNMHWLQIGNELKSSIIFMVLPLLNLRFFALICNCTWLPLSPLPEEILWNPKSHCYLHLVFFNIKLIQKVVTTKSKFKFSTWARRCPIEMSLSEMAPFLILKGHFLGTPGIVSLNWKLM